MVLKPDIVMQMRLLETFKIWFEWKKIAFKR